MSAEFEAAQEICAVLNGIDQNLDRIYKDMPSQHERIATAAMQGILCNPNWNQIALSFAGVPESSAPQALAFMSLRYADALIVALNKPQTGE